MLAGCFADADTNADADAGSSAEWPSHGYDAGNTVYNPEASGPHGTLDVD
jgi:hypothetical protein